MMLEIPVESVVFTLQIFIWIKQERRKLWNAGYLLRKGADFEAISKKFHISPRLASLIRNRDVIGDEAINQYLNGTIAEL